MTQDPDPVFVLLHSPLSAELSAAYGFRTTAA